MKRAFDVCDWNTVHLMHGALTLSKTNKRRFTPGFSGGETLVYRLNAGRLADLRPLSSTMMGR